MEKSYTAYYRKLWAFSHVICVKSF